MGAEGAVEAAVLAPPAAEVAQAQFLDLSLGHRQRLLILGHFVGKPRVVELAHVFISQA